ncbi:MAG: DUF523 domain-containing protein [candidate division Zixibacteria bacterium]
MKITVLVSRCLLGKTCRWNGKRLEDKRLVIPKEAGVILVCPEMGGGLACPRAAAEIVSGDGFDVLDGKSSVINTEGQDVTDNYLRGAQSALNTALREGATIAYLKNNSPSCGTLNIYRNNQKITGAGVTAALFKRHGIKLESIE